jgi:hypothetical protein
MIKKFAKSLEEKFVARLQARTGWGRNDIMIEFRAALNEALMELLDA